MSALRAEVPQEGPGQRLPALVRLARPKQWIKNVLVIAAPGAAGVLGNGTALARTAVAFVCFCLAASGTYFLNDALDVEADRRHPTKRYRPIAAGEVSFEDQGRARVMLRNKGLLRVYGNPETGRFLGAEMVGPDAEHIGHLLAWALQSRLTVREMLEMPFYHPVVEEGLRTALRDLDMNLHASRLAA